MNEKKRVNDGGLIHPVMEVNETGKEIIKCLGISRRDWLAGLAMQSLVGKSRPEWETFLRIKAEKLGKNSEEVISISAYEFADAMIAEGEKE